MEPQKTPEQIEQERLAAELKVGEEKAAADKKAAEEKEAAERKAAEEKAAADKKAAADRKAQEDAELQAKRESAGELHFVYQNRVFVPILPKVNIPKLGIRTALEICIDDDAQQYLVESGCVGTVIKEIV